MSRVKKLFGYLSEENAFYIGFTLFFFTCWMSQTSFNYNKLPLLVLSVFFFIYKNLHTSFSKIELFAGILIFGVGACSYLSTGSTSAIWCAIIVISMKNVSLKKVLKIMLFVSMAITTLVILMSLCGISGEVSKVYFGRNINSEIRYHLGVNHPNDLHFRYLFALALIFGLCYERINIYHYGILFALNLGLSKLTLSRTGFICCSALILAMAAFRYLPGIFKTKASYILINIGCVMCILMSIIGIAGFNGNSSIWTRIDKVASGRLDLGNQCLATYGLSLFGNKVEGYIFDMGIPRVLIEDGILFFIIVYVGMFFVMKYFYTKKQYRYIIIIAVFLLYSMSERMNMYAYYNVQIVLMGYAMWKIFDDKNKEKEAIL